MNILDVKAVIFRMLDHTSGKNPEYDKGFTDGAALAYLEAQKLLENTIFVKTKYRLGDIVYWVDQSDTENKELYVCKGCIESLHVEVGKLQMTSIIYNVSRYNRGTLAPTKQLIELCMYDSEAKANWSLECMNKALEKINE